MANTLVGLLLPVNALTIVSDLSGQINLIGVGVTSVNIRLSSKLLQNQREDGVKIVHGRVIVPTVINIDVIVQTIDGIETLNQIYKDIDGTYTITSRGIKNNNMRLMTQQISQSPEVISASPIRLIFKQAFMDGDERAICQQAPDSSVLDAGISSVREAANDATVFIQNIITDLTV